MRRAIRPTWLIRQAYQLAGRRAGRGQPRNADLRRAVSSGYYAVFHAISLAVASQALPSATDDERHGYARYVSHAAINRACRWIVGEQPPLHLDSLVRRLRTQPRLSQTAAAFIELQEQREAADYDHGADFTRSETLALVNRAEAAVAAVQALDSEPDFAAFCGLVALRVTLR